MTGFRLVWATALAMVAYAEVVDGGCRGGLRLLGPVADERPYEAGNDGPAGFDAWLDALRRWRHWSGGRSAGSEDGSAPVSRHLQHR